MVIVLLIALIGLSVSRFRISLTANTYTALMSAALNGHAGVVKVLLDKGADVNVKDISGRTALKYAESKDHQDVIELLKKAGARE